MKIPNFLINVLAVVGAIGFKLWYLVLEFPLLSKLDKYLYGVRLPANYQQLMTDAEKEERQWTQSELPGLTHSFLKTRSGVLLHYVSGGNSSAPLMVFVHGFPESWYCWRKQLMEFKKDYHVVAFDMRGFNLSEKPLNRKDYQVKTLIEDLEDVIKFFNKPDCTLVGHDWGGAVCWAFAASPKHTLIKRLVIMNMPHPKSMAKAIGTNADQVRRSWYFYFFQIPFWPEKVFTSPKIDRLWEKQLVHKDAMTATDAERSGAALRRPGAITAAISYYRNMFSRPLRSGSDSKKIVVPTLLLWGEQDAALGKELIADVEKLVTNIRVQYFPHASHWIQQDEALEVIAAMRNWLLDAQSKS